MNLARLTEALVAARARFMVAQARVRRAEQASRRCTDVCREEAAALHAAYDGLQTIAQNLERARAPAQPDAGQAGVTAHVLLGWRMHAQDLMRLRAEQQTQVQAATVRHAQAESASREAAQSAMRARVRHDVLHASLKKMESRLADGQEDAWADDVQIPPGKQSDGTLPGLAQ